MITALIRFSGRNARWVIAIAVLVTLWGAWCLRNIRIDALPDLSPTQVIIFSEWMGRSPDLIEDQITYPVVISMLAAPRVDVVRGFSMFGMSFVYVIFEDGTDIYWARSRTLEYLSKLNERLPEGVTPTIGPDATGVGWVFQYALVDHTGQNSRAEIRTFQDWYLRYWLSAVPGVAEVASIGGYEKQYQVEIDPNRLQSLNISLQRVISAIRDSNQDVGGRTLELSEREHYVLGIGYVRKPSDIENVVVDVGADGSPVRVSDLGRVVLGPNIRRGLSDLNGEGDTVGGVVLLRQNEDVSRVIDAVKARIDSVRPSFPPGVELEIVYDRSTLIREAIDTLAQALIAAAVIVSLVILAFLTHFRSALLATLVLPISILASFVVMYYFGIGLNIMSLGGLILAAGNIVDAVVVIIETVHTKMTTPGESRPRLALVQEACQEVGPSLFSALLVVAISFLPIFALQAEEGKLFHPLAYTKTFVIIIAAVVSVTVVPALADYFIRGRIRQEADNPMNKLLLRLYRPILVFALNYRKSVLVAFALLTGATVYLFTRLGTEFMPSLWEGNLLYMPITEPGISVTAVSDSLSRQGAALKAVPEVASVWGKAGKYDTSTDPAPLSMMEFTIQLKPREEWRPGMTDERVIEELDMAVAVPGLNRAWTKPVRGRIDMLSTGIRTPVGVKVFGPDLEVVQRLGREVEAVLQNVRGTKSVYAERVAGGYYVKFEPDRALLGRYGLRVGDVQRVLETAVGGMTISQTVEGRERYTINVRYPRELRDNVEQLERVLVFTPTGTSVPLAQLGRFVTTSGPAMVLDENGSLASYVYVDLRDRDVGGYVAEAKEMVANSVDLPPGYRLQWTGQYEYLQRVQARLAFVLPLTLALIFAVLYMTMRSTAKTLLVMLSVPLSLTGGIFLMWLLDYNMSVAVWAGIIALIGVAVEACSIMVIFLDSSWRQLHEGGRLVTERDYIDATIDGSERSLRPLLMAVMTNIFGLVPVFLATGIGSDVMKRISSPMFGGLVSLTVLSLILFPVFYLLLERRRLNQIRKVAA